MSCLAVIPLEEAKIYLRVDDGMDIDDKQIERMIVGAINYVERYTGQVLTSKVKDYLLQNGCAKVYDYPINAVIENADTVTSYDFHTYTNFTSTVAGYLKLNVGYVDATDVPYDLLQVVYEILDLYYYQHETGKTVEKDLSDLSRDILNSHKRFIF